MSVVFPNSLSVGPSTPSEPTGDFDIESQIEPDSSTEDDPISENCYDNIFIFGMLIMAVAFTLMLAFGVPFLVFYFQNGFERGRFFIVWCGAFVVIGFLMTLFTCLRTRRRQSRQIDGAH